jgi:hypothetical protein
MAAYTRLPRPIGIRSAQVEELSWLWPLADSIMHLGSKLAGVAEETLEAALLAVNNGLTQLGNASARDVVLQQLSYLEKQEQLALPLSVSWQNEVRKYNSGWISRTEYVAYLSKHAQRLTEMLGYHRATTDYVCASYQQWSALELLTPLLDRIGQDDLSARTLPAMMSMIFKHVYLLAWCGEMSKAGILLDALRESVDKLAEEGKMATWSDAVMTSVLGTQICGEVFDWRGAQSWQSLFETYYEKYDEIDPPNATIDTQCLIARAWALRCKTVVVGGAVNDVIGEFVRLAYLLQDQGDYRRALAIWVEAWALVEWAVLQGRNDESQIASLRGAIPGKEELLRVAAEFGEDHLICHIELGSLVVRCAANGFSEARIAEADQLAYRAALKYESARLYRMALAIVVTGQRALGLASRYQPGQEWAFADAMASAGQAWSGQDVETLARRGAFPSGLLWQ